MKSKLRWLLLIVPLALLVWAFSAASWRPKLVGRPSNSVLWGMKLPPSGSLLLISPDGKQLVSSYGELNNGLSLAVWNAESQRSHRPAWKRSTVGESPFPLAFSPDSRFLAVGFGKGSNRYPSTAIVMLDAATGKQRGPQMLPFHFIQNLQSVAFSSPRELVISTLQGVSVVDVQTGQAIRQWNFKLPARPKTKAARPVLSHVSADGTTVLALGHQSLETFLAVYDVKTGIQRGAWTYQYLHREARLSPNGRLWAFYGNGEDPPGALSIYDAQNGKLFYLPALGYASNRIWLWIDSDQGTVSALDGFALSFEGATGRLRRKVPIANDAQALARDPTGDSLYTLAPNGQIWRWRAR